MIKIILISVVLLGCLTISPVIMAMQTIDSVLLKPSGKYAVAFKDLHWINNNICPDPGFSEKNSNDFSPENKQHCHELMIRVYYPTALNSSTATPYYRPAIEAEQNILRATPGIQSKYIEQLALLKSHTIQNAAPVENEKFPVIIFAPGFGVQTQLYENIITELVSHGYIVIGINSVFIHGDIELPNGRVVHTISPQNREEAAAKIVPVVEQDISFVYNKIHNKSQDILLKSMELNRIGALGHSLGGKAIANVVKQHPTWFQALITLDMGSYKANDSMVPFEIPHMHIISAYWQSLFNWPISYQLGKTGYLVVLSPSENNKHYSYHMNYSDFATLQYLPAYQASMAYDRSKLAVNYDVIFQTTQPKENEVKNKLKPTYIIVKSKNNWMLFYYEPGKTMNEIDIDLIPGLRPALNNLSGFDKNSIKKLISVYHKQYGNYLGKGNGFKITQAIDAYVLNFFDHFLKNKTSIVFEKCKKIGDSTVIKCGVQKVHQK